MTKESTNVDHIVIILYQCIIRSDFVKSQYEVNLREHIMIYKN